MIRNKAKASHFGMYDANDEETFTLIAIIKEKLILKP